MENSFVGKQVGHYRIDKLLGRGGMGAVYRAYDLNLARPVAMKVMHRHLIDEGQFKQRFMQEAQAVARLDHPSIVNIHEFGQEDDLLYMVMTFIEGGTLGAYIHALNKQGKSAKLDEILFLLAQVADALGYAHEQGILHRDVKPDNIMIKQLTRPERPDEPPLRAVVTDFGLAKLAEGGMHTATGTVLGTMNYMSPEQCRGEVPTPRSDIYSLGIMLYHLATGSLPYEIKSFTDAVIKHSTVFPPMATELRPDLPPPLDVVINKALAKNPADRFETAEEMATLMRRIRETLIEEPENQVVPNTIVLSVVDQLETDYVETPPVQTRPAAPPPTVADLTNKQTNPIVRPAASPTVTPANIKMVLRPDRMQVSPGRQVTAEIVLQNTGGTALTVWLRVEEMAPWMKLNRESLNLQPGSQQSIQATINVPFDSSATAGQHHYNVRAYAHTPPQVVAEIGGQLQIPAYERFASELRPTEVASGETARLFVRNDGNVAASFHVSGEDAQHIVRYESLSNQLQQVGPGQIGTMDLRIQAGQRPLIGRTQIAPFSLQVKGVSNQQQLQGQLKIKPRIPIAVLALVLVLVCLGGAAGSYALFSSGILSGTADVEGTTQAVAAELTGAAQAAAVGVDTPGPTAGDGAMETVEAEGTVMAITAEAAGDTDNDGLANVVEEAIGTDPGLSDTDRDGLLDGEEINQYNSDPTKLDTDDDGLSDGDEIRIYNTSVNNPDTDGDGFSDGEEVAAQSDPLVQASPTPTMTSSPSPTPTASPTSTPSATPTPQTTGAGTGGGLPLGFESFGVWGRGDQANGTISQSGEQSHSGGSSAKISYDFATADNDFVVFLQFNDIPGQPTGLNLWVYGDGKGHYLNIWIIDSEGQTWQVPMGRVTHTGWALMSGEIDTEQDWPWTHISGPNNEVVDYPIRFRGFALDDVNNAFSGQGDIYLDDLTAVE